MKISPLFLLLFLLSCQEETTLVEKKNGPPNIVWIVAEDLSPIISSFGDSTAKTPNLDRLAARGIRFPNTFSVSGVCAPSRAAIATGMYPTSIGAHNMRTQWNTDLLAKNDLIPYEVVPPPEVKMMSTVLRKPATTPPITPKRTTNSNPLWSPGTKTDSGRTTATGPIRNSLFLASLTLRSPTKARSGRPERAACVG